MTKIASPRIIELETPNLAGIWTNMVQKDCKIKFLSKIGKIWTKMAETDQKMKISKI